MSWIRKTVGLDGVDLVIHLAVTGFMMIVAGSIAMENPEGLVASVGAVSMVALGVRRHSALKRLPPETTGELTAERIAELEARVAELEQGEFRMHELEERLDFAERLLAQAREPERLS